MVWDEITDFAGDRVRYAVSPNIDPEDNPLNDTIREETDLDEGEQVTMEVVGLTDENGDRLHINDSGGLYDGLTSSEYTIDTGDAADQLGEDAGSLVDRIWEVVPFWAWGLGAIVLAGVAYTYTRPLWSIAAGVVPA